MTKGDVSVKNSKHFERLKQIKKELDMDWVVLNEENSKDPSKCAYAIFIDIGYYKKYVGEVGPLKEREGYAIKIKKTEFTKLFKGKDLTGNVRKLLEQYVELEYKDIDDIDINEEDINIEDQVVSISYGDEDEPESHFGTIVIKETTANYIKEYGYSREGIE